jgi:hypothetical protein
MVAIPYLKIPMSQSSNPIKYIVFSFKTSAITTSEVFTMFEMKVNSKIYKIKLSKGTNTATNKDNNKLKIYETIQGTDSTPTDISLYHLNSLAPVNSFEYKGGDSQWTIMAIKFPLAPASTSFKDSYIQIKSDPKLSLTFGHYAYYANDNNELKQYFQYNNWDDINNSNWYDIKQNNTWQKVYYSLVNAKTIDNIETLFNTFLGNDTINSPDVVYGETDSRVLNIAINPEFRIYVDIIKKTIQQVPQ